MRLYGTRIIYRVILILSLPPLFCLQRRSRSDILRFQTYSILLSNSRDIPRTILDKTCLVEVQASGFFRMTPSL